MKTRVMGQLFRRHLRRFAQFWQKIGEPPVSIKDPEVRKHARLFNGLLMVMIPVAILVLAIEALLPPATALSIRSVILGIVVAVVIYALNRIIVRSYRLIVYVGIVFGFVTVMAVAISLEAPHVEILYLIFLPLMSILLFPLWGTFLLCVATLVCLLIFGAIVHDLTPSVLKSMLIFMVLAQGFILFVAQQRNLLEKDRQRLALEKARNQLLTRMISSLSHDFRTPLSVINLNAYLLGRANDPQAQKEKVTTITEQTMRLNKLLDDILTVSRLEHTIEFEQDIFDLNNLLRLVMEQFQPKAADKQLQVSFELARDLPTLRGSRDNLYQVFASIIENAIHYTPASGAITLRTHCTRQVAITEVIDTGIGIDPTDLPLIFDPFFRGDRARPVDTGTDGLGLSIAKRIVELHHGSIEVESMVGSGSTFRVMLPR